MRRTLIITNDFPPRRGGIESFVAALAGRMADDVVVYTAAMAGSEATDRACPYPVVRDRSPILLPTPAVGRRAIELMRRFGCDRVIFGAAAPLGLLALRLRQAGAHNIVAITHGHEVWWAALPGTRRAIRSIGREVDVLTYISTWTRDKIAPALRERDQRKLLPLPPGVDSAIFAPGSGGGTAREALGIRADAPLVISSGRVVKRKGGDTLIRSWSKVLEVVPDAHLAIVGQGPFQARLASMVQQEGLTGSIHLTGGVPEMTPYMDAADVFAMPCRSRLGGLEVEGLGIVFLEASSCEKPIIVGRSGGAPDTVDDGQTGYLVDPLDPEQLADRIITLLRDPLKARAMGVAGRKRVLANWQWDDIAASAVRYLDGDSTPHT